MPYCTLHDLEQRLPRDIVATMTDDEGGADLERSVVDSAIADADSMIDSYLSSRYAVPLTHVPLIVNRIACDLTLYYLFTRKYESEMPEAMRNRYTDAVKLLTQIQQGHVNIGTAANEQPLPPSLSKSNKNSNDRVFSKGLLNRW
jgi:phage gp36-like protein